MHYVYVIKSLKDRKFYIGQTNDLKQRFSQHQSGENTSTQYRRPFVLVYYEAYKDKKDAVLREEKLKQFKNTYKRLIERLEHSAKSGGGSAA